MAVMMGSLYAALVKAVAEEDVARKAAEEVAYFDGRGTGLEGRIALLDGKLDAKFGLLSWMIGFNIALTLLVAGLVLRSIGIR